VHVDLYVSMGNETALRATIAGPEGRLVITS
jgi:hypothetical protein